MCIPFTHYEAKEVSGCFTEIFRGCFIYTFRAVLEPSRTPLLTEYHNLLSWTVSIEIDNDARMYA